jgi:hypothetical protein
MFIFSENELPVPLKNIGQIKIVFTKYNNNDFIYNNLEYPFIADIIPLITSILECKPLFFIRKTYTGITQIVYRRQLYSNPALGTISLNNRFGYDETNTQINKSFYIDIEKYNKTYHENSYTESAELISCIQYQDSNEIVKIYPRISSKVSNQCKNKDNILMETVNNIVSWKFSWGAFELIISNEQSSSKCRMELIINIIEESVLIFNKMDEVNSVIEKIHKIKSSIFIEE